MGTYIVGAIVLVIVCLAASSTWKTHKNGGCSGGCTGCTGCDFGQSGPLDSKSEKE